MLDKGLWIALEGVDGVGKTTAMKNVVQALTAAYDDLEIIQTSHPGATPLGAHLRTLVKHPEKIDASIELDPLSEQLFMAIDHINFKMTLLGPALDRSAVVVADRCNLISSIAYGMASGLTPIQINSLFQLAINPRLDRLYVMTCSKEERMRRLYERTVTLDKFEKLKGVAEIYDGLITGPPERTMLINKVVGLENVKFINASGSEESVAKQIVKDVKALIADHKQ